MRNLAHTSALSFYVRSTSPFELPLLSILLFKTKTKLTDLWLFQLYLVPTLLVVPPAGFTVPCLRSTEPPST